MIRNKGRINQYIKTIMLLLTSKVLSEEGKKMLKAGLIVLEGNEARLTDKASRILATISITDTNKDEVLEWADAEIARQEAKTV